jgi:hypothetical protein
MNMESYKIEIDCEPGPIRPDNVLKMIIKDTFINFEDFEIQSKLFGNWTWNLDNKLKVIINEKNISIMTTHSLYKKYYDDIKNKIILLYDSGMIRYSSTSIP